MATKILIEIGRDGGIGVSSTDDVEIVLIDYRLNWSIEKQASDVLHPDSILTDQEFEDTVQAIKE